MQLYGSEEQCERVGHFNGGVGAYNKSAFAAAVQTSEDGKPLFMRLTPIKAFTKQTFVAWAQESLAPNAHVVSDGLPCFTKVTPLGSHHERHITGGGRQAAQTPQLHWVI